MTDATTDSIRSHVAGDRERIFQDLSEVCSFNSVHNEPGLEQDCAQARDWVVSALESAGLEVEQYPTSDGSTTVIGTRDVSENAPTVLLYSHYDVVPVGDRDAWISDPLTLTEREGRWYARGAADCKGNLVMHLAALRAVEAAGGPSVNLTVLIEGSEERGGAGLDNLISERPELFAADVILIADTGNAAVGEPTLTTSLRGGAQVDITVNTLKTPVHSGSFGGGAPDAVAALIRALDSLRDDAGRTVIDGVDTTGVWSGEAYDVDTFRTDASVLDGVELVGTEDDKIADLVWARPAVTVTGFTSTPVAESLNAVPATASARINLRVPVGLDPQDTADKLAAHLKAHVPFNAQVETNVFDVNPHFSTDTEGESTQLLTQCLAEAYGLEGAEKVGFIGSGASIPLTAVLQSAHPNAAIALYGVEEPLATIHSPNESVDPEEIVSIAAAEALFLLRFGK
ncbi:dipeptidase [Corynebacterium tapiri]|uniref:Dipeptidase n=1 Tax=Corynebacterium tapiri TaxID=1448266 RepID=A0A5C4U276_9CORY|nr:dipeptidase [Corynebacterium tapiri]TNL96022.1 dipeptidase [Corynebacterium tapiri]